MIAFCKQEWRYFLLALGFFTRLPISRLPHFQEEELNHSVKYFPLVGLIVGMVGVGALLLSAMILPSNVAILVSMASTIYLTGAFHEDGLADSADGFGGGWDSERILTIMQDSRLGTFGVMALFLMLFAKYQLLNALPPQQVAYALIVAHALSRLCAVYVMSTLSYVKPSGKAKPLATKIQFADLTIASVFGLLPLALIVFTLTTPGYHRLFTLLASVLLPVGIVWLWWVRKIKRWIGGYTGDCLGAMQQLTELAFYLGLVVYFGSVS